MNHTFAASSGAVADAASASRLDSAPAAGVRWRPPVVVMMAGVAVLLFFVEALLRRLNFDEALALKGGWLALEGLPSRPPFAMPVTLLSGAFARVIADPGGVFLGLRMMVAVTVLAVLVWAFWRAFADLRKVAAAVGLTLAAQSFSIHAYEFRYDWAVLVAVLVAYAALLGPRREGPEGRDWVILGWAVAWCACHHLKGVGFGVAIAGVAAVEAARLRCWRGPVAAVVAAAGWLALWIGACQATGLTAETLGVYTTFADVASDWRQSGPSFAALGAALRADLAWWVLAALAAAATAARSRRAVVGHAVPLALSLALVSLLSTLFHPHPWPYMLTPAVPFLAVAMTDVAYRCRGGRRWLAVSALVAALALQRLADSSWPLAFHHRVLRASRSEQVQVLRDLRRLARDGDRIVDPSGMAWFLPPCGDEWYVDTLFVPWIEAGRWMANTGGLDRPECRWLLVSYRFELLPEAWQGQLQGSFVLLGEALAVRWEPPPSADQRTAMNRVFGPHRDLVVESFW